MAIATLQQMLIRTLLVIGFISLAGCGGSDSKPKDDTTPNAFTFIAIENAEVSAQVDSDPVTITGINKATPISIVGGEYAIGDVAFTATAGTVTNNQSVKVRLTSSVNTNTPVTATLTIGGVVGTFTVTTAPDVTPEPFSFEPDSVVEVEPNSEHTSSTITVNDIDIPVAINIINGEYKIGDGAYTSAAGTISNNQTVTVKTIAPNTTDATKTATLTIGGVSATYSVTTYPDEVAPTATIDFPLPSTATIAESITIRGTAADDFNTITSLTVQISGESPSTVAATSDDGFATWQAVIPLVDGANTLTLITEDSQENINEEAAQVVVHKQAFTAAFPNNDIDISNITAMVLDKTNNRAFVMKQSPWAMVEVDMTTGERSIFSSETVPNNQNLPVVSNGIVMDMPRNRALIAGGGGTVYSVSLADEAAGARTLLTSSTVPTDAQPALAATHGIALDPTNSNVAYVLGQSSQNLARMDITTGERTLVSDNNMPDSGAPFIGSLHVEISANGEYAWVVNEYFNNMLKVNLATGVRTEIGTNGYPETGFDIALNSIVSNAAGTYLWGVDAAGGLVKYDVANDLWSAVLTIPGNTGFTIEFKGFLDLNEEKKYLVFAERNSKGVYLFDLVNSQYVILSKFVL